MAALEQYLGKKYKLTSSENFEEYLKFLNIGLLSRKAATSVSPVACLVKNEDGSYTFTLSTVIRNSVLTFRLGEEFEEDRVDGVKVKSTVVLDGDQVIQTQVESNGRKSCHVRIFTPTTLTVQWYVATLSFTPERNYDQRKYNFTGMAAACPARIANQMLSPEPCSHTADICLYAAIITTAEEWDGKCVRIYEIME